MSNPESNESDIAIVGMAAHLPGARNIGEYWRNVRDGVESIQTFTDEQLLAEGESPEDLRKPNYVRAGGPLPGAGRRRVRHHRPAADARPADARPAGCRAP